MRASPGHSYNGYYSGLLIRQIRVRIPGGPYGSIILRRSGRRPFKAKCGPFITGGSSTGRALKQILSGILTADLNCYSTAEVIGSNPVHRAFGHIQKKADEGQQE